jgi:hypothetical protein
MMGPDWRDVVVLGNYGQQIGVNTAKIDALASNHQLAAYELSLR